MAAPARKRTSDEMVKDYLNRWSALKLERSSWMTHWQELSEYFLPRTGRFIATDSNRGEKKHNNIYDNTGTRALRVLGAGLMSGMTSPARPWFRLDAPDPDLNAYEPVREWLELVTQRMRRVFALSNTYRSLHQMYEELALYGTASAFVLDDFEDVIRFYPLTAGEYALALDDRGMIDTVYREYPMTVAQLVGQFGIDKVSMTVRRAFESRTSLDQKVQVLHLVEPRKVRDVRDPRAEQMPYASCYIELGAQGKSEGVLRESGFRKFRALCPRWSAIAGDVYGSSPGMESLGDVKQLQHAQFRKAQGIDYKVLPPVQVPAGAKSHEIDTLPGGVSYIPVAGQSNGMRTAFEVNLDLSHLLEDIQDVRGRIQSTFFADLFLMLANDDRSGVTAREVIERHEEKMLMLGPVLERLHDEMLHPLIDITFDAMMEARIVPPPPKELQGRPLQVEFVSVLAQAQRAVGVQSIDRLIGTVGAIAGAKQDPSVWDTIDTDRAIENYAEMLGVDPHIVRGPDEILASRHERAKAIQQQAAAAQAPAAAQAVKNLAEAKATAPDLLEQLTGYTP